MATEAEHYRPPQPSIPASRANSLLSSGYVYTYLTYPPQPVACGHN